MGVTDVDQCIEVHFASFLSGGFTSMSEKKLAKGTSVQWFITYHYHVPLLSALGVHMAPSHAYRNSNGLS